MSRTIRRQKGDRWWALHGAKDDYMTPWCGSTPYTESFGSYDEYFLKYRSTEEDFNSMVRRHTTDGLNGHGNNRSMKSRTNEMRRMQWIGQRACFYKHPEEHNDFYDSKARWKHLWWVYH